MGNFRNILYQNLIPKISDFGISKYSNEKLGVITQEQKGTPVYQSPEQFPQNNKPNVGTHSDVYSFGNIIYEILYINFFIY
jgi:serine/threonine protein kinase